MICHFTASVYIFHRDKILLHQHKKHGKYPPLRRGHVEENKTPEDAAFREVKDRDQFKRRAYSPRKPMGGIRAC